MTRLKKPAKKNPNTPVYNIGVASALSGLPVYTIRWLETNNLLVPGRTTGNQRLFSENDIEKLRQINALLSRHVNVQGIKVIMGICVRHKISITRLHISEDEAED